MELPIYKTLSDFRKNYEIIFSKHHRTLTPLEFYTKYNDLYIQIYSEFDLLCEKLNTHKLGISLESSNNWESKNIFLDKLNDEIKKTISNLYIDDIVALIESIKFSLNKDFFKTKLESLKKHTLISYDNEINLMQSELIGIMSFTENLIKTEKINLLRYSNNTNHTLKIENEIPEYDFSDNEDKVKLIILEKLGVIDYIKSIQQKPEVISHTAEILSSFTGIKSNSLYSYLRPMISPQRDDSDKNSPYKNADNLLNANRQIHDLKINDANK